MIQLLEQVGFRDVKITDRFDCFRDTSKAEVAEELGVHSVNIVGYRAN